MSAPLTFRTPAKVAIAAAICLAAAGDSAEAQIVRGRVGRGVVVSAPFVRVQVGPIGIPGLPYGLPRRRVIGAVPRAIVTQPGPTAVPRRYSRPSAGEPQLNSASGAYVAPSTANSSTPTGPTQPTQETYPTVDELQQMDDGTLLNTLVDLTARLDERVARFDTGATWQRYLRLPDDALPPPSADGQVTLGMKSLAATLDRFDSIASNSKYRVISDLPLFVAAHSALRESVERFGSRRSSQEQGRSDRTDQQQDQPVVPRLPSAEDLPPPEPTPPSRPTRRLQDGRPRSILKR